MSDKDNNCEDIYGDCQEIKVSEIIGAKTLNDGGLFGDIVTLSRKHIEDAKKRGELTESESGTVFASFLVEAMKESFQYALSKGKIQKEIALAEVQRQHELLKMDLEERATAIQERQSVAEINKIECECNNSTRLADSKLLLDKQEIEKMKCSCDNETRTTDSKINLDKSAIEKNEVDMSNSTEQRIAAIKLNDKQIEKIDCECDNATKATISKLSLDKSAIEKNESDILNQTELRKVDVSLKKQQKSKLESDAKNEKAINDSKISVDKAQIKKMSDETNIAKISTDSKVELNKAQAEKMKCDCENNKNVTNQQAALYRAQTDGFAINARQKLFETQLQAWSMVYQDIDPTTLNDIDSMTDFTPDLITRAKIEESFTGVEGAILAKEAKFKSCEFDCPKMCPSSCPTDDSISQK